MTEMVAVVPAVMVAEVPVVTTAEVPAVVVMVPEASAVMAPVASSVLDLGDGGRRAGDLRRDDGGGGLRALRRAEQHRTDHRQDDGEGLDQAGSSGGSHEVVTPSCDTRRLGVGEVPSPARSRGRVRRWA
jgi:hypothetical protein